MILGIKELLFPTLCPSCNIQPKVKDEMVCLQCAVNIEITDHFTHHDNRFVDRFLGRINIVNGASLFYVRKAHHTKNLIYQMKYTGNDLLCVEVGRKIGRMMKNWNTTDIDGIIPIPITKEKMKNRGYNQARQLCLGIEDSTRIPVVDTYLQKDKETPSQTTMGRSSRLKNVADCFATLSENLGLQHIVLVDDVVTTGATLEAAAKTILSQNRTVKISMVTAGMNLH